jgi:hypothetical protein
MERKWFLAGGVGALLSGCGGSHTGGRPHYRTITSNAEPLRSRFNHDVGKVRIVMLVSPT